MNIEGAVALVTGGTSGLGFASARAPAKRGARVALLDLSSDRLDTAAAAVSGIAVACNVTDGAAVPQYCSGGDFGNFFYGSGCSPAQG